MTQLVEISHLSEFIELITTHPFFQTSLIYRGQSKIEWRLIPKIFRPIIQYSLRQQDLRQEKKDLLDIEQEIYREFFNRIRGISDVSNFNSSWDYLCYAQHYGVPTRLLDWTTNPLIALYFSSIEFMDTYGVVWCYTDHSSLKSINQVGEHFSFLEPFRLTNTKPSLSQVDEPRLVLFRPAEIDLRLRNQSSVFLADTQTENFQIDYGQFIPENQIFKIIIKDKVKIRSELERIGVHSAFIFPDMKGMGDYLDRLLEIKYDEKYSKVPHFVKSQLSRFQEFTNIRLWFYRKLADYMYQYNVEGKNLTGVYVLFIPSESFYRLVDYSEEVKRFLKDIEAELNQTVNWKESYNVQVHSLPVDNFAHHRKDIIETIKRIHDAKVTDEESSIQSEQSEGKIYIKRLITKGGVFIEHDNSFIGLPKNAQLETSIELSELIENIKILTEMVELQQPTLLIILVQVSVGGFSHESYINDLRANNELMRGLEPFTHVYVLGLSSKSSVLKGDIFPL